MIHKIDHLDPHEEKHYHSPKGLIITRRGFFHAIDTGFEYQGSGKATWMLGNLDHKLVATGKFGAYIYGEEGELIEHEKETRKQVRALSFLAEDVEQYRPAVQRRPRGGKTRCPSS